MKPEELKHHFWFGTHYYRAPSPPEREWKDDFKRLKDMGLDTIQARVFWRWHERQRGVYTWGDLDRLMDLAAREELKVIHQVCLENAPQYVFDEFDGFRVDIRGQKMWPIANAAFYVGGWIPCFDHLLVMEWGLKFVEQLVERYRSHEALSIWHAWNEPRCRPMGECACTHSIRSYRQWLMQQFGNIEVMNERFGKCWGNFDQIDAARDTCDFSEMYLWRQWGASRVRHRVQAVVDKIRQLDPEHAVISHVGNSNMQQDPLFDISDDVQMADVSDLYGSSFAVRYEPESAPFMICDWMRHVGRGHFSIYELYPSIGLFLPEIPYYQVQQWIWTAVASGSNPLFLWQFKKERLGLETNDAGLVEIDGRDNPTSLDARKNFAILKKEAEDISKWKVPQAPIGIVYDLQSDLVNRLEMTNPRDGDYVGRYDLRYRLPGGHAYKANLQGTYHLFWLNNLHADIVSSQRLGEVVDQYKLLYLPSLYVVDQERADLLYRFVEQGGTLIADAGFARRDSNTWLHPTRPGSGLSELFGYWEEFCAIEPSLREKCCLESGSELETGHERITFKTSKAVPCGWWKDDETPAAVTGTIGKGRFLMLGFSPGISYLLGTQTQWPEYLRQIIVDWAGIQRPFWGPKAVPGVTLRRVIDKNGCQITFAFRRWGKEVAMEDAQWSNWSVPESNLLFELSHVKCFVSK